MNPTIPTFFAFILIANLASATERKPPLSQEPRPLHDSRKYTDYKPQPPTRVRDEVLRVASNGSFVSHCLLVISCDGREKNFETITGQDGLTFGITDFASDDGVYEFLKLLHQHYPGEFKAIFAEHSDDLLNLSWIKENNGGGRGKDANDNGLVRFDWFRTGLDKILSNRRYYGLQLANFREGKVDPCLKVFKTNGFQYELTLGAMIAVANSVGPGGMNTLLKRATNDVPLGTIDRERHITEKMLSLYVSGDPLPGPDDSAYMQSALEEQPENGAAKLGHRADRVRRVVTNFPPAKKQLLNGLGDFSLEADERLDAVDSHLSQPSSSPKESANPSAQPLSATSQGTSSPSKGVEEENTKKQSSPTPAASADSPIESPNKNLEPPKGSAPASAAEEASPHSNAPNDTGKFDNAWPASESNKKWLKHVRSMDLENDTNYSFPELAGKTSCMLKIDKDGKTVGSFLWRRSSGNSGNPNTEIAYFNMARILGFENIVRPGVPFKIGPRAITNYEKLLKNDPINNQQRQDNRTATLAFIQSNPGEMRGALKCKKPKSTEEYNEIVGNNGPNMDDPIMRLVQADQPMPAGDVTIKINKKIYKASAVDTGRAWSNLLVLDVIFGQWDRFSQGNVTIVTQDDTFALFSTDNGGADFGQTWPERNVGWFSRYDTNTVARLKQLSAFLEGQENEFGGYTNPKALVVDLGLYQEDSPANYVKKLSRTCKLMLATMQKSISSHGEANALFASRK